MFWKVYFERTFTRFLLREGGYTKVYSHFEGVIVEKKYLNLYSIPFCRLPTMQWPVLRQFQTSMDTTG